MLTPFSSGGRRGSIIILVMVTLLFTAAALVAFLDKAGTDLLVDARAAQAARLRPDAYSALETTLAVLQDFRQADGNQLRAPTEGWSDPLGWAGWTPSDPNHTVDVSFQDESGKIPLIHADQTTLLNLFESPAYGSMASGDAQRLIDGLLGWMHADYSPVSALQPDYPQSALPYAAPGRSIRSMSELTAIDAVRDVFFDANGRPNSLWWQFYGDFSIFNYTSPNINGANPDILTAVGQFDDQQVQNVGAYLAGTSQYSTLGRKWFNSPADLQVVTGQQGQLRAFAFTIRALRIIITVHEGKTIYTLSAVVAPATGGARTVQTNATDVKNAADKAAGGPTGETASNPNINTGSQLNTSPSAAQTSEAAKANLQFPFTVLEIRENDEILTPPPPPPTPTDDTSSVLTAAPPVASSSPPSPQP
jgi:hypothetical protein